jgi:hypothetical protein
MTSQVRESEIPRVDVIAWIEMVSLFEKGKRFLEPPMSPIEFGDPMISLKIVRVRSNLGKQRRFHWIVRRPVLFIGCYGAREQDRPYPVNDRCFRLEHYVDDNVNGSITARTTVREGFHCEVEDFRREPPDAPATYSM